MSKLLEGAYDLHVHAGPDVVPRKMDDIELAESYIAAGMKGFTIKAHYFNTEGRAYHIRKTHPGFNAIGSVVLNNSMGGLNPYAVRQGGMLGTRFVYMPTMDAQNMWDTLAKKGGPVPFGASTKSVKEVSALRVAENGKLAEPIEQILDYVKQYDMVLCSGHINPEESLLLYKRASEKGIKRMLATHVEWSLTRFTIEQQKKLISYGVKMENNIANIMNGEWTVEGLLAIIRELGAENFVLDTDLGQANNPVPVTMFEEYAQRFLDAGLTKDELHTMIVDNPKTLVE